MDKRRAADYNPKKIGEKTEAKILSCLVDNDKVVLLPFGDNQRYDIVVEEKDGFKRIQCKTGRLKNGVVSFQTCSSSYHRNGKRHSYRGQIEYFGVFCHENGKCYFVPVNDVGIRSAKLRVERPANGQERNINWAKDYEAPQDGLTPLHL
ncbi:MAG TPA: hypothetical protein ENG03_11295 [Thioploca sp.]|nr:MAG: hypothetical protein DRR19_00810 [Gammaproteobacteria bacterium]HDN27657.1 hypothetical protein [Thioploca sp.]